MTEYEFDIPVRWETRVVDGRLRAFPIPGRWTQPIPDEVEGDTIVVDAAVKAFGSIQPYRPDGSVAEQTLALPPLLVKMAVNRGIELPTGQITDTGFRGPVGFGTGNPSTAIELDEQFPMYSTERVPQVTIDWDYWNLTIDPEHESYEQSRRGSWMLGGEWSGSVGAPRLVGRVVVL